MLIMVIIFFCMFAVLRSAAVQTVPHRILQVIQTKTKPPLTTILSKRHQFLHRERNPHIASNCFRMASFQCALWN